MMAQALEFAEKLTWEMTTWTAIEVRARRTGLQSSYPPPRNKLSASDQHYIETAAGLRYYDDIMISEGKVISHTTRFFDGEKAAGAVYDPEGVSKIVQVVIQPSFGMEGSGGRTTRPEPLPFLYVAAKPLHEALRSPKVVELGPSTVISRECVRFQFPQVEWAKLGPRDTIYDLDKQTGIPLKVEIGNNPKQPDSVWEALSLNETAGGRHLPFRSRETVYNPDGSVRLQHEYTIQDVKYDQTYDKSMFWPKFDAKTTSVIDRIRNTRKMVPVQSNPNLPVLKEVPEATATVPAPLIQAAPPVGWSAWGVPAAILLGCALIAAAILLRMRQSSAA